MDQKIIDKLQVKTNYPELLQKTKNQDFLEYKDLESLNQAIYNLDLGMDLLKKVDIPTQIKQHSKSLSNLLKEIKQYQDISIANHKAAKSAPKSLSKGEEFLKIIISLT
tara:strand:- start:126 stop:452 length:327 start_codon:yes stop_codon:yes gene_type:complete